MNSINIEKKNIFPSKGDILLRTLLHAPFGTVLLNRRQRDGLKPKDWWPLPTYRDSWPHHFLSSIPPTPQFLVDTGFGQEGAG